MFKEKLMIYRGMPTADEVLSLGSALPEKSDVQFQHIDKTEAGFESIEGAKEMVVFIDKKDPKSILQHPVLGRILQPYAEALFVERMSPLSEKVETTLRQIPFTLPVAGMGSVEMIHLVTDGGVEGDIDDPTMSEFILPLKWRNNAAKLKNVIGDLQESKQDSLAIYLDGRVVTNANAPHAVQALARALGNLTYEDGLYKTKREDRMTDGAKPETKEASPEDVSLSTRSAIKHVYLVSDFEAEDEAKKATEIQAVLAAFNEGDTMSRVQSMCKFLAECPHNLLDCELFVRVLIKLNEAVKGMGNNCEIEIHGPQNSHFKVDGSTGDLKMSVLDAVHQGSGKEWGPARVRMKYRSPEAAGQPVHLVAGKSLMFDSGGRAAKGALGKDMKADMMGGASIASLFARFGEDKPAVNVDFVWGIASNRDGADAREHDDVMTHAAGRTVKETNTDAEGREVLGDVVGATLAQLIEEGETIGCITTVATLTGHAIVANGHQVAVVSSNRALRNRIEDVSIKNGETVQTHNLSVHDLLAMGDKSTDIKNISGKKERGLHAGAAYIKLAAGIEKLDYVHFDMASAIDASGTAVPEDIQGQYPVEGYLGTLYDHISKPVPNFKKEEAA
ncbi:hypothetical protein HY605_00080 [Candidatus Peregrinibacteria bacterium]|nr:hypothetical protein [Candidatus Peregrinibacteria bacterium]